MFFRLHSIKKYVDDNYNLVGPQFSVISLTKKE